jgi:DNA polymerase-3 subunit beta
MFSKTIFAVSSEELRPALMGVFLQMDSEEIRMVATDGHRLSKIVNKSIRSDKGVIRIIIPPKAVQLAIRHLDGEGSTRMTIDESGIMFFFDRTTLFSRLVEGEYPDYERVIPRDNDIQMAVDKNMLLASVKRVSLFSSALTHQIRFSLNTDRLTVCSEDPDMGGEAKEELAVNYKEDPMEIGYNSQYVLDVLKHIDTDELVFLLKSPVRAALVSPAVQNDDENFIMLVMPIKLST